MTEKDVIITVKGEQILPGEQPDRTELVTEGRFLVQDGVFRLQYEESELTGMEGTTTEFLVADGQVVLSRRGTVVSRMVFEMGKKNSSLYQTPYGSMRLEIHTTTLRNDLTPFGGRLDLCYIIGIDGKPIGHNSFMITVREK